MLFFFGCKSHLKIQDPHVSNKLCLASPLICLCMLYSLEDADGEILSLQFLGSIALDVICPCKIKKVKYPYLPTRNILHLSWVLISCCSDHIPASIIYATLLCRQLLELLEKYGLNSLAGATTLSTTVNCKSHVPLSGPSFVTGI